MSKTSKTVQMACLSIGYHEYLMPADKAMKVAELMQAAFNCRHDFDVKDGRVYRVEEEQPDVAFTLVRAGQLRMPAGEPMPTGPVRQKLLK